MNEDHVDLLNRAATKVRERAAGATPGARRMWNGWGPTNDGLMAVERFGPDVDTPIFIHDQQRDLFATQGDWEFMALWSTGLARLVADWLEGEAATIAAMEPLADLVGVTIQHTSGNEARVQVGRTEAGGQRLHARTDSFAVALARSILEEEPS